MLNSFKKALELFSKAHRDMTDEFQSALKDVQRDVEEKRAESQKEREEIKKGIENGGRITNHRIDI